MKSSINKRAPWEERGGARLHHQLARKEEDLALFQDMRIRESSANCSPSSLDPSSPLDHLHASGKFRGAPLGRNDLLTSEMDKSDYDWLLTPPGTPLFPSLDRDYLIPSPSSNSSNNNTTNNNNTPRDSSSASRKLSRLSTPAQQLLVSSSSSGSSISSASKLYSRGSNPSPVRRQSAPLLNTSTNTPSSGIKQRPTPNPSTTGSRPSTPTRRPSSAPSPTPAIVAPRRSSTPTRTPPSTSSSRPSTPTRTPSSATSSFTSLSSSASSARPSTPTRRSPNPISPGTSLGNGRVPSSRGTSPVRRPVPDRSLSTSSVSSNASSFSSGAAAMIPSSTTTMGHLNRSFNHHLDRGSVGGDHHPHQHLGFSRRAVTSTNDLQLPKSSDTVRKPAAKFCGGSRETSFFGTSISKKSIDTAIRHMDIRRSSPGGFRAPPPAATATYPKSTRSQIHQQNNHQGNNNHHLNHYHQEMPDYSRLMSGEDKPVNGLFEHVQDAMDDSFLLEFNSLTASSEATFLEGADYLKDP